MLASRELPSELSADTMIRSHSPDDPVLHDPDATAAKRTRVEGRPPLADVYLESLTQRELVHLVHQIEELLQHTRYAETLRALLYPANLQQCIDARRRVPDGAHDARGTSPLLPASPSRGTASVTRTPSSAPAAPRPYTPSIPAQHAAECAAAPDAPADAIPSSSATQGAPHNAHPAVSGASNISSRIAAILESLQNSNASGPMLGLQGQPLAPPKQAPGATPNGGNLSSLLSNTNLLGNARLPANSALSKMLEQSQTSPVSGTARAPRAFGVSPAAHASDVSAHVAQRADVPTSFDFSRLATSAQDGAALGATTAGVGHAAADDALSGTGFGLQHDVAQAQREPRMTSTLPSYEDMIVEGLQAIGDVNGTPPRMLFHWMEDTYPLMKNFRPSASQALQKAFKRGRLHKVGSLYRINPDWDGSNTGRKPTRRPQVGKDHPMMVNGPKGPAPASPFKSRAQFQGAAAYRQATNPLSRQRTAHSRLLQSLRPGPKPYGQPGAAPLDNPANSIFQNGAAAAALLVAHQQRTQTMDEGAKSSTSGSGDAAPTLTSLVQQLRSSARSSGDAPGSSLSSMLASALLKHAQRPSAGPPGQGAAGTSAPSSSSTAGTFVSSPVLQSLSRLLDTNRAATTSMRASPTGGASDASSTGVGRMSAAPSLPTKGPGSLSASIETLVRQATRAAQAVQDGDAPEGVAGGTGCAAAHSAASQADLDAAVSQTLEAAFQQITPQEAQRRGDRGARGDAEEMAGAEQSADGGGETDDVDAATELGGINLADYGDALRTLTAALASAEGHADPGDGDEEATRLAADERAIEAAEAAESDEGGDEGDDGYNAHADASQNPEMGGSRMSLLLKSYGIDVSSEALRHLTETLRDPNVSVPALSNDGDSGREREDERADAKSLAPAGATDGAVDLSTLIPSLVDRSVAEATADASAGVESAPGADAALCMETGSDATSNEAIQSQLEALIASLASESGMPSDAEEA
ncbi:hypothetical protein MSPP1_002226 [Malassezia sp. CBS 17886]|nr:hypothetical protein MSPP1_002226 [Malassezia sp. CBS 17886]